MIQGSMSKSGTAGLYIFPPGKTMNGTKLYGTCVGKNATAYAHLSVHNI